MFYDFVADGPHSWRWIRVQIPKHAVYSCYVDSPILCYKQTMWNLRCGPKMDGTICLWLYMLRAQNGPLSPFVVSVQVWDGSDRKPVWNELGQVVDECGRSDKLIWQRKTSDVERIVPGFSQSRLLSFRIEITARTGLSLANAQPSIPRTPCPRPEIYPKTFADASVQTSLTTDSFPCLHALSTDLAKMLDAGSDPNVEILCDGRSTRAHRDVLCSRSPVLAKMLQSDMVEGRTGGINLQDMDSGTFGQFLRYLYTGRLDDGLTFDAVMSLYEAGDMYGVEALARRCSKFLVQNLKVDNACHVLAAADAHSDGDLKEEVTVYILENKVPRCRDIWRGFCKTHPVLATEVYHRYFELAEGLDTK